jgi:CMP-N,N'-diacetyllegionaminic acid synthase
VKKKIVATICARGGSKGVPRKNIRLLCDKPLLTYSIEVAGTCDLIDRVIVSTDDTEIAAVAREAGAEVPFLRPTELAVDNAPKLPVLKHVVRFLESNDYCPDIIVDLDPTSPMRTQQDIKACVEMVMQEGADNVFSVVRARKNPYFNVVEIRDGRVQLVKEAPQPVTRRQDAPEVYEMNASIYVWRRDALMRHDSLFLENTRIYVMPEWAIDIDSETDFQFVEFILRTKIFPC